MSFLPLPKKNELDGHALEMTEDAESRWGYVPNIVRAYSLAPKVMAAEDVWSKGVMHEGLLPRHLKEAIATVVSKMNEVNYCASSHAHAFTLAGGSETQAAACKLLDFATFNEREKAALLFAQKATQDFKSITKNDIEILTGHYTSGEVVEIATVIQQFMGYNYFVTILGLELEPENKFKEV